MPLPLKRPLSPGPQGETSRKRLRPDNISDGVQDKYDESMSIDSQPVGHGGSAFPPESREDIRHLISDEVHELADRFLIPFDVPNMRCGYEPLLQALWFNTNVAAQHLGISTVESLAGKVPHSLLHDPGYINDEVKALMRDKQWKVLREHGMPPVI